MEYIAVLNNHLEYSLGDNHTGSLAFQRTSMRVFHATVQCPWNAVLAKAWYGFHFSSRIWILLTKT